MGRANSCCSGISHEILDAEGLVRLFFIKNPRKWLTKEDVASYLQQNGKKLAPGSLYNVFYRLKTMSVEDKLFEIINDYADGVEAVAVKLKRDIGELMGKKNARPRSQTDTMADTEEIHWTVQVGAKGEYEKSVDKDNPRHQALLKTLQAHQGAIRSDNWFIWTFDDGVTIGRKRLG